MKLHALLIDAGAEFGGYTSDITRTYSYDDAEFAEIIRKLVKAAELKGIWHFNTIEQQVEPKCRLKRSLWYALRFGKVEWPVPGLR